MQAVLITSFNAVTRAWQLPPEMGLQGQSINIQVLFPLGRGGVFRDVYSSRHFRKLKNI
jgi:hypothetical protein